MPPKVLAVLFIVEGRVGTAGDSVADVITVEVSAPVVVDDTAAEVPLLTSQGFGGDGIYTSEQYQRKDPTMSAV